MVKKIESIFSIISKVALIISGISLMVLMFFIVLEVVLRSFFNYSILGNYEFSQNYLMPLIIFPPLVYTYAVGIIPRFDMVLNRIKSFKTKKVIFYILMVIEMLVFAIVTYFGFKYAVVGMNEGVGFSAGGKSYPIYPALFLVPIGFILLTMYALFSIVKMKMNKDFIPFTNEDKESEEILQ